MKLDGMGTNFRGKAFHDVAWKNLKDSGFPTASPGSARRQRPGPGWTSPCRDLRRQCRRPERDARGPRSPRFLPGRPWPIAAATTTAWTRSGGMSSGWAGPWMRVTPRIQMPTMPTNWAANFSSLSVNSTTTSIPPAPPRSSRALQKAGKEFEYMPIIGAGHGAAETPFGSKARLEFLKKHLKP